MKLSKKATMKDIAKLCGVSAMAVSKALGGKGGVSKDTAKRIAAAAKKLNYTPNMIAKSLRVNETRTLGVVVSDSSHLLFAKMLAAISEAAEHEEYSVIMANTGQSAAREKKAVESLVNKRIDGLLLAAPIHVDAKSVAELLGFGIPVALLMRHGGERVDSVVTDNYRGGYEMVDYLLKTGSGPIHMINLSKKSQSGKERLRGYRTALRELGSAHNAGEVLHCPPQIEEGYAAMRRLLEKGITSGAVFCGCDVIAIGAIRAVLEKGFSIPGDFRICGYDDIELLDDLKVPLTTMRQPAQDMGREAIALVLKRIREPRRKPERIVMPGTLVVRAST